MGFKGSARALLRVLTRVRIRVLQGFESIGALEMEVTIL